MLETSIFFEIPKSEILITPLLSTRMLAPLMSSVDDLSLMEICESSDDLADKTANKRLPKSTIGIEHGLH